MFVHFGLYSAIARHEWVMNHEKIQPEQYAHRAQFFDPDLFDAREIANLAVQAGMKYAVLTTKHHEGFAMFDSAVSDYTVTAVTGRDIVAEFVAAMREAGIRVGLYFSVVDWHHPDYTLDGWHPSAHLYDLRETTPEQVNAGRNMDRYRKFLHAQVRTAHELRSNRLPLLRLH